MSDVSFQDQKQYYDDLWRAQRDRLTAWQIERLARILMALARLPKPESKTRRICELGCGVGWLSRELAKFGEGVVAYLSQLVIGYGLTGVDEL